MSKCLTECFDKHRQQNLYKYVKGIQNSIFNLKYIQFVENFFLANTYMHCGLKEVWYCIFITLQMWSIKQGSVEFIKHRVRQASGYFLSIWNNYYFIGIGCDRFYRPIKFKSVFCNILPCYRFLLFYFHTYIAVLRGRTSSPNTFWTAIHIHKYSAYWYDNKFDFNASSICRHRFGNIIYRLPVS